MKLNQRAFSAVEGLLILLIVVIVGATGAYVYTSNKNANKNLKAASQDASGTPKFSSKKKTSTTPTSSQQYFTVKEWGVQAPYSGTDTLTYTMSSDNTLATVTSKQLATKDSGCSTFGAGQIKRLSGTDPAYAGGDGPTVTAYAAQNPGMYTKVGAYYYQFVHDQAQCGSAAVADQNQANDATKALVAKFQATN